MVTTSLAGPAAPKKLGSAPAPGAAADALVRRRERARASSPRFFPEHSPPGGRELLRRYAAHPPLCVGGTRQGGGLPGKIRPGRFGPQLQGRASRLCQTCLDENSVAEEYEREAAAEMSNMQS